MREPRLTPGKCCVSVCPDTQRVFICEIGVDNNILEVFGRRRRVIARTILRDVSDAAAWRASAAHRVEPPRGTECGGDG